MSNYWKYRTQRIIANNGPTMVFRRVTQTVDPVTQLPSTPVNNDTVIQGILLEGEEESFSDAGKSDVVVTQFDVVVAAPSLPFTPMPGDFILLNGSTYRVVKTLPGYDGKLLTSYSITVAL